MRDAVAELVRDGDTVAIEGFTHLIGFAAGHEIIRQRKRDLTLARLTPDLIYDQMIAAGVARKLIFSWLGNPGVGGLGAIRRRTEGATSAPGGADGKLPRLELEEYSHFGMVGRYTAGAANLPFYPIRSYFETDLPKANPLIREIESPYGDGKVYAVPPLKPDVTIVHAQRADAAGNTQVWGLLGCQKEAAFAADRLIVVVEELVDESVVRADPNRTIIPGLDRRRGGRRAVRRAPVVRPGRVRPRQPVLSRLGRDHEGRGRAPGVAAGVGVRPRRARGVPREARTRARRVTQAGLGAVRLRRLRRVPMSDAAFSKSEMMIVAAARELAGQRVCFVGVGLPNIAVNLAKRTVTPDLELVYEAGVFGARPARLPLSIGDPTIVTGATSVVSMYELFSFYLQGGLIDVGFLGAAQIDRFGNINTTVIGDYAAPATRLPGSGGACEIAINARQVFVIMRQSSAVVRRADRLPDVGREPRAAPRIPSGSGGSRAGSGAAPRSSSRTSGSGTSTSRARCASTRPSRLVVRGRAGGHRLGAEGRHDPRDDAGAHRRGASPHPRGARSRGRLHELKTADGQRPGPQRWDRVSDWLEAVGGTASQRLVRRGSPAAGGPPSEHAPLRWLPASPRPGRSPRSGRRARCLRRCLRSRGRAAAPLPSPSRRRAPR